MSQKNRIKQLEKATAQPVTWDVVRLDKGQAVKGPPALIGKTEAELDAIYNARPNAKLIKVVFASQIDSEKHHLHNQ